jgi:hypothetical protein
MIECAIHWQKSWIAECGVGTLANYLRMNESRMAAAYHRDDSPLAVSDTSDTAFDFDLPENRRM